MCAAPGSKTTQLIEMLHADMSVPFPGGRLAGVWRAGAPSAGGLGAGKLLDAPEPLVPRGGLHTAVLSPQPACAMQQGALRLNWRVFCNSKWSIFIKPQWTDFSLFEFSVVSFTLSF